jgi:hypothetical protein
VIVVTRYVSCAHRKDLVFATPGASAGFFSILGTGDRCFVRQDPLGAIFCHLTPSSPPSFEQIKPWNSYAEGAVLLVEGLKARAVTCYVRVGQAFGDSRARLAGQAF